MLSIRPNCVHPTPCKTLQNQILKYTELDTGPDNINAGGGILG